MSSLNNHPAEQQKLLYLLPFLTLGVLFFLPLYFQENLDIWFHLKIGEWIVQHLRIPQTDIYSFTSFGEPVIAHEWLPEVIFYWIHHFFSWTGLAVFRALLFTLTWGILLALAAPRTKNLVLACLMTLGLGFLTQYWWVDRPHIFAHLFFAVLLWLIATKAHWGFFFFLFILWANSHGSFPFGLGFLTILLWIDREKFSLQKRWQILLAALTAACITPIGPRMFLYPFLIYFSPIRTQIEEWQPLERFMIPPWAIDFPIAIFLVLLLLLLERKNKNAFPFLLLILLALQSVRHLVWPILFIPYLLEEKGKTLTHLHLSPLTLPLTLILLTCLSFPALSRLPLQGNLESSFPKHATTFLKNHFLGERMGNPFQWGGYLLYHLSPRYKVLWDGRCDPYLSNGVFAKLSTPGLAGKKWTQFVAQEFKPDFFLFDIFSERDLTQAISQDPLYAMVYWDEKSAIFLKKTKSNTTLVHDLGYQSLSPFSEYSAFYFSAQRKKEALLELGRALQDSPTNYFALNQLAMIYHEEGNWAKANQYYYTVVALAPRFAQAHFHLAKLGLAEKNAEKTSYHLAQALALDPSYSPPRILLQTLKALPLKNLP